MRPNRLLELSRHLHDTTSLEEVMKVAADSLQANTRYIHAFLLIPDANKSGLDVVGYAFPDRALAKVRMAEHDYKNDRLMMHLLNSTEPEVYDDLRTCELADQRQVEAFGNRTSINIPMLRLDKRVGVFVVATFAAQGVLPPTPDEMAFILEMAALVSMVASRIAAEDERRLLEAMLARNHRLESLGRMAGQIAHDFNNMLVGVICNAELALDMIGVESSAGALVREAIESATRAAGLSRQLLAFSKGQPTERRDVDVNEIIQKMLPTLRPLLPATVALEITVGAEPHIANADATQVEQVLMNLIINARDALLSGGRICVRIETVDNTQTPQPSAGQGRYVCIEVEDSGSGISPEHLPRIFEPYFTTKGRGMGTGLGLAVVDSVVRMHGGFISVDSEVGRGTKFRVFLQEGAQTARSLGAAPQKPKGLILVVDDEAHIRSLLVRILGQAGYRVSAAENGKEALALLASTPDICLVVTDLVMPVMGGAELIKELESREGPPILVVSGYAPDDIAHANFPHILSKPFHPRDLLQKVSLVLAQIPK